MGRYDYILRKDKKGYYFCNCSYNYCVKRLWSV